MTVKRALCLLALGLTLSPAVSAAATLTGLVVDATNSTPLRGATVSVDVLIPDSLSFSTLSDSLGAYSLPAIPRGNAIYVIRCYVYGFTPFYMRYDALALGDRQVDISMYPEPIVPPGGGGDSTDVSGVVLHEAAGDARNPVEQATVTLRAGGSELSAWTGTDGKFLFHVSTGNYTLRVEAANYEPLTAGGIEVDSAGLALNVLLKATALSVSPPLAARAASFSLESGYPNPFNPATNIRYHLASTSNARLVVLDLLGREVRVLVNERKSPGSFEVRFDASGLSTGIYLCRLVADEFSQTRKLVLLR